MDQEIRIAGGGLAGMTAAINLALRGYSPLIYELRRDVGLRFAGDFQYFENWTRREDVLAFLKRMNIRINFPIHPVTGATACHASGRAYEMRSDRVLGYMVRRGGLEDSLDTALKRQALQVGVRFEFGRKAKPDEVDIVATGPDSRCSYILVHGMVFDTDLSNEVCILFDRHVAPGVYAYLVAHQGKGVICTCFTRRDRTLARKGHLLIEVVNRFQSVRPFNMSKVHFFGNYGITPLIEESERPVVGEAAGFQDANWGFGMRLAILSGALAAEAVADGKDYWHMVRQEVIPWVKSTWTNRLLFETTGDWGARLMLAVLSERHRFDHDLAFIYRPHLWKSLIFTTIKMRIPQW